MLWRIKHLRRWTCLAAVGLLTHPAWGEGAREALSSGRFAQAAQIAGAAAKEDEAGGDASRAAAALGDEAIAEENLGNYSAAVDCLRHAARLDGGKHPQLNVAMAEALILARSDSMGMTLLPDAGRILDSLAGDPSIAAGVQSAYGSLYLALGRPGAAAQAYEASLAAARGRGDRLEIAQAAANAAVAYLAKARALSDAAEVGDSSNADALTAAVVAGRQMNQAAWAASSALPAGHSAAMVLLTIGKTDEDLAALPPAEPQLRLAAFAAYEKAGQVAEAGDDLIRDYTLGYTGHLYELDGRDEEARRLTAQALFLAEQLRLPNLLYLWQWQMGRLLAKGPDRDAAIAAYQDAAASLRSIQTDLSAGGGNSAGDVSFRQTAGNVYYELADLLLRRAEGQPPGALQQAELTEARQTVEALKTAELQNYFQDRCERLLQERRKTIETLDAHTAVVYFIPLADRVEILVSVSPPGGGGFQIQQFSSAISADQLNRLARRFRVEVRDQSSEEYFDDGQAIYQRLIAPIEPFLSQRAIDTLVFVPDGALRSVPMAALPDEQGTFLIEKYAVAISPGLRLTEAAAGGQAAAPRILISGLSIARDGFPALQYVPDEVGQINRCYAGRALTLLNADFVTQKVDDQLQGTDYSIVHIASHGHFGGDARDTYILDYDGHLDLDELERLIEPGKYRQRPVDLLTLSACETAAGDDRAALGLAGIAVKAGALSAMATLWSVNDRSSATLVPRFYLHLSEPMTKAKALRAAQLDLIHSPQFKAYRHPYFWSPYLIVGNWL